MKIISANVKDCIGIPIAMLGFGVLELCLEIIHWKDCGDYDQNELLPHYWQIQ